MLLENENNSADKELKAVLYDYISSKIRELANVSDTSFYEQYVKLLADITDSADSLAIKIERLESLQFPVSKSDSIDSENDLDDKEVTDEEDDTKVSFTDTVQEKSSEDESISPDFDDKDSSSDVDQEMVNNTSEVEDSHNDVVVDNSNAFTDIFANASNDVVTNTAAVSDGDKVVNNVIVNENVQSSSSKTQIKKLSDTKAKAILVNRKQLSKLSASRNVQKSLLDFGLQSENTQNKLEEMMARASSLYKEGKVQEAQALYNEISLLNKANNNVLVKTA